MSTVKIYIQNWNNNVCKNVYIIPVSFQVAQCIVQIPIAEVKHARAILYKANTRPRFDSSNADSMYDFYMRLL